jgi:tetratricopeptide (TPR) repeat protein
VRHQRAIGDDDTDALQMHAELSDLEFEAGHLATALASQKELLDRSVELLGPRHQRVGRYTADVAESLVFQGKYDEAVSWIERARPIIAAGPAEHLRYVEAVEHIGLGEVDRGIGELRTLIEIGEHDVGVDDPYPLSVRADVAKWLSVHRRPQAAAEADALVRRIAALREDENPWYSIVDAADAIEAARAGKVDERIYDLARHAVGLAEHGALQLPYALLALGEVLIARGDYDGAKSALERARVVVTERGGIDPTIDADIDSALARARAKGAR